MVRHLASAVIEVRSSIRKRLTRRYHLALGMAVCIVIGGLLAVPGYVAAQSPSPSGVVSEFVSWITVSPAYSKTGVVLAVASQVRDCKPEECTHLWISRNGGSSWKRAKASGWAAAGRPVIAVGGDGKEVFFSPGDKELQRSDDLGDTWVGAGANGFPMPSPTYPKDGMVAVAANPDYIIKGGTTQPVKGSGGAITDLSFTFPPSFPDGGSYSPALLVGSDKSSAKPVIQQCSAELSCQGSTSLTDVGEFAFPVTLSASTAYSTDGVVFAQAGRSIHKSTDGGVTFLPLKIAAALTPVSTATPALVLAPKYREAGPVRTAYVAVLQTVGVAESSHTEGGIYRSSDGGVTWKKIGATSPLDQGASALAIAPDGRLFAGYLGLEGVGLLCSSDDGDNWQPSCSPVGKSSGSTTGGESKREKDGGSSGGSGDGQSGTGTEPPGNGNGSGANYKSAAGTVDTIKSNPWATVFILIAAAILIAGAVVLLIRRRNAPGVTGKGGVEE